MQRTLLVIDDCPFTRSVFRKVFAGSFDIHFAGNEQECSCRCGIVHPDVVYAELRITDVRSVRRLCNVVSDYSPLIPVIIAAENNTPDLEQYIRIRGMFYYLVRPFTLAELWDALEAAFQKAEQQTHPEFLHQHHTPTGTHGNLFLKTDNSL